MAAKKHLSAYEHYREAVRIYAEGMECVAKVRDLDRQRKTLPGHSSALYPRLTRDMDDQGMKAHGCWMQANYHATMSLNSSLLSFRERAKRDEQEEPRDE